MPLFLTSKLPLEMSSTDRKPKPLLERLGDVLIYIIAFPFIAVFIALKRVFTE